MLNPNEVDKNVSSGAKDSIRSDPVIFRTLHSAWSFSQSAFVHTASFQEILFIAALIQASWWSVILYGRHLP